MIKLFGGALIVLSCFLYSGIKIGEIKRRIEIAEGLISGFVALEEQVCGLLLPIERALLIAAGVSGDAADVFSAAAKSGGNVCERFSNALGDKNEFSEKILPYISGITAIEEEERRCAFALIRARIEEKRSALMNELYGKEKLYGAIGVPIGILIVILLY